MVENRLEHKEQSPQWLIIEEEQAKNSQRDEVHTAPEASSPLQKGQHDMQRSSAGGFISQHAEELFSAPDKNDVGQVYSEKELLTGKDSMERGGESGRTSELQSENMFSNITQLEQKMQQKQARNQVEEDTIVSEPIISITATNTMLEKTVTGHQVPKIELQTIEEVSKKDNV